MKQLTETIQTLAQRVNKAHFGISPESADAMLAEIDREYGRTVTRAVLDEMSRQARFAFAEQTAEHERHQRQHADAMRIFEGLPSGTRFEEACRIKAAGGDIIAEQYVCYFGSREYRLEIALVDAAVAAHPGWRANADGTLTKLDESAPEVIGPLVEWFQMNYPKEAKRIEAEVDAA